MDCFDMEPALLVSLTDSFEHSQSDSFNKRNIPKCSYHACTEAAILMQASLWQLRKASVP